MIRTLTTSAIVFAAVAALSGAASAETVRVGSADLNLSSSAGLASLDHRVAAAVTKVCGTADMHDLSETASIASCRKAAKSSAAQQIAAATDLNQRTALRETDLQIAAR